MNILILAQSICAIVTGYAPEFNPPATKQVIQDWCVDRIQQCYVDYNKTSMEYRAQYCSIIIAELLENDIAEKKAKKK